MLWVVYAAQVTTALPIRDAQIHGSPLSSKKCSLNETSKSELTRNRRGCLFKDSNSNLRLSFELSLDRTPKKEKQSELLRELPTTMVQRTLSSVSN